MIKKYFEKLCKAPIWFEKISLITKDYTLNHEQECAFRIVANHVDIPGSEQLKMYIGGMGGTRKSQVLKSLMKFFDLRGESHQFVVVAPMGNAASLLGGSTYHYMFGINDQTNISNAMLSQVKDQLIGIDYIFLNEVSMLSCHDLYCISEWLGNIMNTSDIFGSLNIIFTGDFTQLPPAIGHENASLYSHTVGLRSST